MHEYRLQRLIDDEWVSVSDWDYPDIQSTQQYSYRYGDGRYRALHWRKPVAEWILTIIVDTVPILED